jgi:hypothetical protein
MYRTKYFAVSQPEKLMMRKQGHVSDNSEIGMVEIDVLPFLDVLVLLQPAVVHFEVDEVADRCAQNSNDQQNT